MAIKLIGEFLAAGRPMVTVPVTVKQDGCLESLETAELESLAPEVLTSPPSAAPQTTCTIHNTLGY